MKGFKMQQNEGWIIKIGYICILVKMHNIETQIKKVFYSDINSSRT